MIPVDEAHARLRSRLAALAGQDGAEAQRQRLRLAIRDLARSGTYPDAALTPRVSLAPWILSDDDPPKLAPSAPEDLPLDFLLQTGGVAWESADAEARRAYLAAARVEKRRHLHGLEMAARAKEDVDFHFWVRAVGWGLSFGLSALVSLSGGSGGYVISLIGGGLTELVLMSRDPLPPNPYDEPENRDPDITSQS